MDIKRYEFEYDIPILYPDGSYVKYMSHKRRMDDAQAEIERLKADLDCATNNQWGKWELERGEIKGHNMALEFEVAALRSKLERVRECLNDEKTWTWTKCDGQGYPVGAPLKSTLKTRLQEILDGE